jgi:hypothetical protein
VSELSARRARGAFPRRALGAVPLLLLASLSACGPKEPAGPPVGVSERPGDEVPLPDKPVDYLFDSLDERAVSSEAMRGKPTVLAIINTGSMDAQAQLAYLAAMAKNDGDRVNYAAVALHSRREIPLVDVLMTTVKAEFPVALAEPTSMTNAGAPFGEIVAVPTVVVLDRKGRLVWKHTGLAKSEEVRARMAGL